MRHPELQREKEPFSVTLPGSPHPQLKSGTYPVQLRLTPAQLPTVKFSRQFLNTVGASPVIGRSVRNT